MDWETDWLYQLIFDRVRDIWQGGLRDEVIRKTTISDYIHAFGEAVTDKLCDVMIFVTRTKIHIPEDPPLERLFIQECANADLSFRWCVDPIVRSWIYDGHRFTESSHETDEPETLRGQINARQPETVTFPYRNSAESFEAVVIRDGVRFHISPDRDWVVFNYWVGTRLCGRGYMYKVVEQGPAGKLDGYYCWGGCFSSSGVRS